MDLYVITALFFCYFPLIFSSLSFAKGFGLNYQTNEACRLRLGAPRLIPSQKKLNKTLTQYRTVSFSFWILHGGKFLSVDFCRLKCQQGKYIGFSCLDKKGGFEATFWLLLLLKGSKSRHLRLRQPSILVKSLQDKLYLLSVDFVVFMDITL